MTHPGALIRMVIHGCDVIQTNHPPVCLQELINNEVLSNCTTIDIDGDKTINVTCLASNPVDFCCWTGNTSSCYGKWLINKCIFVWFHTLISFCIYCELYINFIPVLPTTNPIEETNSTEIKQPTIIPGRWLFQAQSITIIIVIFYCVLTKMWYVIYFSCVGQRYR